MSTKISGISLRIYLPHEALQGEEVPSFALWQGTQIRSIEVKVPKGFNVREVYNVARTDWTFDEGLLSIKKVEVEGYVGLLMDTEQLDEPSAELDFGWHLRFTDETFSDSKRIHLFRPLLHVNVPNELKLVSARKKVINPVLVENHGLGTVVVNIRHLEESDVKVEEPQLLAEIRKSMYDDFRAGFSELKKQFPQQGSLIDGIIELVTQPALLGDEQHMARYKESVSKVQMATLEEQELGRAIGEVLATAIIANLSKYNIFQQLAEYLLSVTGLKVILTNPLDTVRVKAGKSSLDLSIDYTDLGQGYYHPVEVKTRVSADGPTAFPVFKLLQWVEG